MFLSITKYITRRSRQLGLLLHVIFRLHNPAICGVGLSCKSFDLNIQATCGKAVDNISAAAADILQVIRKSSGIVKVEKILKRRLDLISSPSRSHKHLNFSFLLI